MLRASFADQEALAHFLTTRLARVPGIVQSQTALALRMLKEEHFWLRDLSAQPIEGSAVTDR